MLNRHEIASLPRDLRLCLRESSETARITMTRRLMNVFMQIANVHVRACAFAYVHVSVYVVLPVYKFDEI